MLKICNYWNMSSWACRSAPGLMPKIGANLDMPESEVIERLTRLKQTGLISAWALSSNITNWATVPMPWSSECAG